MDAILASKLHDRLRWPAVPSTVPGSLPVLFFGDLPRARVATIGLNPSRQEYLSRASVELDGSLRRFETLGSLGATDRASLTPMQAAAAIETMGGYFAPSKPVYSWFAPLARVVDGFGASFTDGSAAHLDLVQEATDPVWSKLGRSAAADVLARDLQFLRWQIEAFGLGTLICTSATVLKNVMGLVDARVVSEGALARIRWTVATGQVSGRAIHVAGWNIPLARPTGLDAAGQVELGALLRDKLRMGEAA